LSNRLAEKPPSIQGLTYIRLIGSGGFADVYLYEQDFPRRRVAVKVLRQKIVDKEVRAAFVRETDVMAQMATHPAILTIYQAGVAADGRAYLISELCEPVPARTWRQDPLSVERVLEIGVNLASALETLHRNNRIHRDIKPSNILSTQYGHTVLADFGVASMIQADSDSEEQAISVPWSAPEVVALRTPGTVASEVWSLGATLYSLLSGRSPFETTDGSSNSTEALKKRIMKAIIPSIGTAGVPQIVESAIFHAMAKDPSERFGSMQEFAMALNEVQMDIGLRSTPLNFPISQSGKFESVDSDNTEALEVVFVDPKKARPKKKTRDVVFKTNEKVEIKSRLKDISPVNLILGAAAVIGFAVALVFFLVVGA
jgi:serine/threonine protein kinase